MFKEEILNNINIVSDKIYWYQEINSKFLNYDNKEFVKEFVKKNNCLIISGTPSIMKKTIGKYINKNSLENIIIVVGDKNKLSPDMADTIESIKDGIFSYNGKMIIYNIPNVYVFSKFVPSESLYKFIIKQI